MGAGQWKTSRGIGEGATHTHMLPPPHQQGGPHPQHWANWDVTLQVDDSFGRRGEEMASRCQLNLSAGPRRANPQMQQRKRDGGASP